MAPRPLRLGLFVTLLFACEKTPPTSSGTPASGAAGQAAPEVEPAPPPEPEKSTAPSPEALPHCATAAPDDPLGAVCKLGGPALEARFDCETPEPLMFCGAFDEWSCKYLAFEGKEPPPITYRARFDHDGPPVKAGEVYDEWPFKRSGRVRGVAVHVKETDDARGFAKAAEWSALLTEWGCVVDDQYGKTKVFSCGTWKAETTYNEIIDQVILEAALEGFLECKGP